MGDIFEDIADRVASARTRALMGDRLEALEQLQGARLDFLRFQDVLRSYPGALALEHSIATATQALCEERATSQELEAEGAAYALSDGSIRAA